MDFIGTLLKSQGFDIILLMMDKPTNYIHIEPTHFTATAQEITDLIYHTWYRQFGLSQTIVSDRNKLFTSKFWKDLHQLLDIKVKLSTSHHDETDSSTELANKTVIESLRNYVNRRQMDWVSRLIQVETVFNNSVNATTQKTPTELVYGTPLRLFPSFTNPIHTALPTVSEYLDRITESIAITKDNHLAVKTTQAWYVNQSRWEEPQYKVGQLVILNSQNIWKWIKKGGRSVKFYPRFLEPFKTIESWSATSNYKLELFPVVDFDSIHPVFHAKLLKPFVVNNPEAFPTREHARPPPIIPKDNMYLVEFIRDHRVKRRQKQYLIHWLGYPDSDDSWVPEIYINEDLEWEYYVRIEMECWESFVSATPSRD